MNRLRLLTVLVFVLISVPVFVLGWLSLNRLEQEERAKLAFFCSTLLDRVGMELDRLLISEEERGVVDFVPAALLDPEEPAFVLARAEIAANGEIRLAPRSGTDSAKLKAWEAGLRSGRPLEPGPLPDSAPLQESILAQKSLETRYFASSRTAPAPRQQAPMLRKEAASDLAERDAAAADGLRLRAEGELPGVRDPRPVLLEVEPFQVVHLEGDNLFLYRRVQQGENLLRQGLVVGGRALLEHLLDQTFRGQPIAANAGISLAFMDGPRVLAQVREGEGKPLFTQQRTMYRPFQSLQARVDGLSLPFSAARATLLAALAGVGLALGGGFAALLRGAWVMEREARRREGFVSSVTHELKTPLANIRLYMEMLEQGMAKTPERERQYYTTLFSETDRLARLITNILEFSRLESRTRRLEPVVSDPAPVFRQVRDILAPQLEKDGFTLTLRLEPCRFSFDPEALLQVLLNLVENSIKFCRTAEIREIELACSTHQGPRRREVRLTVRDAGPGIPAGDLGRVFDDFYRCGNELTRTTSGTGIGLALARRFTQAMGGEITAQNNADRGCTFTLIFPAAA